LSIVLFTTFAVLLRILSNPAANVFQKSLTGKGHHPLAVNFLSYLGLSILCLIFAFRVPWNQLPVQFWTWSVLSGIAGATGNGFLVRALQKGDLSVLGPINAYKSVVGILTGIFLLGELPNLWGLGGTALIIGGSYFVLDTTEDKFSWALFRRKEIQYRLWALVLTAIEAVLLKKVILASSVSIAFLSWCGFGALFSFLLLPLYKVKISAALQRFTKTDFTRFIFLILCLGLMQFTTNFVFDHMPVGYALALFQLSTIISVLLGYRIFKEGDIPKKLLGAAIMLLGSVLIILMKES
jgi:drug/metabolite transporter (DMT)-like permease